LAQIRPLQKAYQAEKIGGY
jgi:hypothetical protein